MSIPQGKQNYTNGVLIKQIHEFLIKVAVLLLYLLCVGHICQFRLQVSALKPNRPATTESRRWEVQPIGRIESPYVDKLGTPKQATISACEGGTRDGIIQLFDGYESCIEALDGFDYIWVISWMHLNMGYKPVVRTRPRVGSGIAPQDIGLFASRAPHRPNPIALSALRLIGTNTTSGQILVRGLDLLDHTPVLDIKPYVPAFDAFPEARAGWLDDINPDPLASRTTGYQTFNMHPREIRDIERQLEINAQSEGIKKR